MLLNFRRYQHCLKNEALCNGACTRRQVAGFRAVFIEKGEKQPKKA
jgi:hypothetical protein